MVVVIEGGEGRGVEEERRNKEGENGKGKERCWQREK